MDSNFPCQPTNEIASGSDELATLRAAFLFTLTDSQRLIQESDVAHICPSPDVCFAESSRVRCGPCAVQQSRMHGVEPDPLMPSSPVEYRLKRRLRAADTEVGILNEALLAVVGAYEADGEGRGNLRDAVGAVVGRYVDVVRPDFDPELISITSNGHLAYGGVELVFAASNSDGLTLVRQVDEWAIRNLTLLPGGRWRLRNK